METLEQLERKYFILQMQDKWDSEDYRYADELEEKIRKLKGEKSGRKQIWRSNSKIYRHTIN